MPFGNENRTSILPVISPLASPAANYNPSDELPAPREIGVYRDGSMSQVIQSFRALGYYTDMIGFGQRSSSLSLDGAFPIGNNYFMKTGMTCDNGADMWYYVKGIPEGSAFGERVQKAIKDMGLPELKGLAPGIIEDAKDALNIKPVIGAMFGKGFPRCRLAKFPVGDARGRIQNAEGEYYIEDPGSAAKGDKNLWYQEKWIQDVDRKGEPVFIDNKTYRCTKKTRRPDGSELPADQVPALPADCKKEGFISGDDGQLASLALAGALGLGLLYFISRK